MSEGTTIRVGCPLGLTGTLTVLFVLLKAFGKISWSWWWVFSPLWIPGLVMLVVLTGVIALTIWTSD